jgi:hypothetical protein
MASPPPMRNEPEQGLGVRLADVAVHSVPLYYAYRCVSAYGRAISASLVVWLCGFVVRSLVFMAWRF